MEIGHWEEWQARLFLPCFIFALGQPCQSLHPSTTQIFNWCPSSTVLILMVPRLSFFPVPLSLQAALHCCQFLSVSFPWFVPFPHTPIINCFCMNHLGLILLPARTLPDRISILEFMLSSATNKPCFSLWIQLYKSNSIMRSVFPGYPTDVSNITKPAGIYFSPYISCAGN